MRFALRSLPVVFLLALMAAAPLAADPVTLEGTFVWVRSDEDIDGDLKAIFTPTGKQNEWTVDFHFEWEDGPHVYSGTAKGDLKTGTLEGEVLSDHTERPKTTFRFSGSFEDDGVYRGKHQALRDGEADEMGTLTLKAAG